MIEDRKADHLDLCKTDKVAFKNKTNLLECVHFLHAALPELAYDEIDISTTLLGKALKAPFLIAGMTGGHERARDINRGLAQVAEERGYAFGLGSQRAMQRDRTLTDTYMVRDVAPSALIFGNLGAVQAAKQDTAAVGDLVAKVGADALCIHLNPAQELAQPEGDRDFRGCAEGIQRLAQELGKPIIAKETGAGISEATALKLKDCGVSAIDVGGAGGTSWVGVETMRANSKPSIIADAFWDWGIPTASSILYAKRTNLPIIATGGLKTGLDAARALSLGADCAGFARVVYKAFTKDGIKGVHSFFDKAEAELRAVMLLTASSNLFELNPRKTRLDEPLTGISKSLASNTSYRPPA